MLCKNNASKFYEFVPGWFDGIEVKNYEFRWAKESALYSNSDEKSGDYLVWKGSLRPEGYVCMNISYGLTDFAGASLAYYVPFEKPSPENQNDGLSGKLIVLTFFVFVFSLFAFLFLLDSAFIYGRGRGFIIYGGRHGRGGHGGGGGCACAGCACACACAGGGRAGCSQKDFFSSEKKDSEAAEEENRNKKAQPNNVD